MNWKRRFATTNLLFTLIYIFAIVFYYRYGWKVFAENIAMLDALAAASWNFDFAATCDGAEREPVTVRSE